MKLLVKSPRCLFNRLEESKVEIPTGPTYPYITSTFQIERKIRSEDVERHAVFAKNSAVQLSGLTVPLHAPIGHLATFDQILLYVPEVSLSFRYQEELMVFQSLKITLSRAHKNGPPLCNRNQLMLREIL